MNIFLNFSFNIKGRRKLFFF